MPKTNEYFALCDDEDGREICYFADCFEAAEAAEIARTATGNRDFYVQPMPGAIPKNFTSRAADNELAELCIDVIRLTEITRTAKTEDEFYSVIGLAKHLARAYMLRNVPIPAAVADAAQSAWAGLEPTL